VACAPANNHFLSITILPPDSYHLAFLKLKIFKVTDKKRLGKGASPKKQLPNWSTNSSAFLLASCIMHQAWGYHCRHEVTHGGKVHDINAHYKFSCKETFSNSHFSQSDRFCLCPMMFLSPPTSGIYIYIYIY
jgi:hypothetical protein